MAAAMKEANPRLRIGMVGATVAVEPQGSLAAAAAVDFVAGAEFDFTIKEAAEGREFSAIDGLSYRDKRGLIVHNPPRPLLEDMDKLPFVSPVYKRDLDVRKYFIGYLKHPYLSFYTGRGCKSRCTFCLWPQTVGGHRYRTRSVGHVMDEVRWALRAFPEVKEIFFDDDTFTDHAPRAAAIARELGKLGVTWSCNAKANVGRDLLKTMRENGLRLLLVGYKSGNQQICIMSRRACAWTWRGVSHATATTSGLLFTARSSSASRRDQRNDRGDDPLRVRDQSPYHPSLACCPVPRH